MTKLILEKIDENIGIVLGDIDEVIGKTILPKRSVEVRKGDEGEPSIVISVR
jgi:hypothetical protein